MKKPFKRKIVNHRKRTIIAYDLETTNIEAGTPRPLYITAYGENLKLSMPINDILDLLYILREHFLLPELSKTRYAAWNGNNYDAYFIAAALLHSTEYIIRPYLTKSKTLRGLKVALRTNEKIYWEFLDGMSMTGINRPLKDFLKIFAPSYEKLSLDFSKETFDANNFTHVKYAERDSEGLYYALCRANDIVVDALNVPLMPTIGNLGIKAFARYIPEDILVWEPPITATHAIQRQVKRGGFCHLMRPHDGPVWKYDINQAYASAMRENYLPAGRCVSTGSYEADQCGIYRINASHDTNIIPFYYKNSNGGAEFGLNLIADTWITSIEYQQLLSENWFVELLDGFYWQREFTMTEYVDILEQLRINSPGGPGGAQGLMMKSIGNNSYGKTLETLDGVELLLALEKPGDDYHLYHAEDSNLDHIWFKLVDPLRREYHQPQLGSFITAYVRMIVRQAALKAPLAFIYADTDCVVFSEPVDLDIHSSRYGAWKIESDGENYRFIAKKVYANHGASEKHAKGLNIKTLIDADFINWYKGVVPVQQQLHKNNFIKCMMGDEMFVQQERRGTSIKQ